MSYSVQFHSEKPFSLPDFLDILGSQVVCGLEASDDAFTYYYVSRPQSSTTLFALAVAREGFVELTIDGLASYADYCFFPYLADSLSMYLEGCRLEVQGMSAYQYYGEGWIEQCIGEAVARVKSVLSVCPRCYIEFPLEGTPYLSEAQLAACGVTLHSSTPRIYGYVQYLMRQNRLRQATPEEIIEDEERDAEEQEVDVPQHIAVGRVKSWQIDGSETWESYSRQDVDALLELACDYQAGRKVDGVVLNDIGTLYQEGIGVEPDGKEAAYWFAEACRRGDRLYAPTNLGDLYRKGGKGLAPSLPLAFDAYRRSEDVYSMYRIGQAYEEGWVGSPDMEQAMYWYRKAAEKGHYLAVARLQRTDSE